MFEFHSSFKKALEDVDVDLEFNGRQVHTERWQANTIVDNPAAKMIELLHCSFGVDLSGVSSGDMVRDIAPNLPWADDHFKERVCGQPINPGIEWANWPWAHNAEDHLEDGMFNHNYMERYWPRYAAYSSSPTVTSKQYEQSAWGIPYRKDLQPHYGLRHKYGDLNDLIQLLASEPMTRQAYLPIWFPEDTGVVHSGRKPCTLGYHFIMRDGKLDVTYYIRSCDYYRHLRDDIYLTVKLLNYVLDECKKINPKAWGHVQPGKYIMHITSLHLFINDYIHLYGRAPA